MNFGQFVHIFYYNAYYDNRVENFNLVINIIFGEAGADIVY
jgi:hypothetical protein